MAVSLHLRGERVTGRTLPRPRKGVYDRGFQPLSCRRLQLPSIILWETQVQLEINNVGLQPVMIRYICCFNFWGFLADPLAAGRGPPGSAEHRLRTPGLGHSLSVRVRYRQPRDYRKYDNMKGSSIGLTYQHTN